MRIGVLASGRGSNLRSLVAAEQKGVLGGHVVAVAVDKEEAGALQFAASEGIEHAFIGRENYPSKEAFEVALVDFMRENQVELVCLAGFFRILGPSFLDAYRGRILNIHPSLLPSFPGLHAQRQALEYGVRYSGCTVHFVDEGLDSGPIVVQKVVAVHDDDTEADLAARILEEEHKAYPEAIALVTSGKYEISGRRVGRKGVLEP